MGFKSFITELSKPTLARYVRSAIDDQKIHLLNLGNSNPKKARDADKKYTKRDTGIDRALKKLAK